MTRCPFLLAIELSLRVIDAGLGVIDYLIQPIAEPAWNRFAALVLPQENPDA